MAPGHEGTRPPRCPRRVTRGRGLISGCPGTPPPRGRAAAGGRQTRGRHGGDRGGDTAVPPVSPVPPGVPVPPSHAHRSETCPRVGPRHGHRDTLLLPAAGREGPKTVPPMPERPSPVGAAQPRCPSAAAEEGPWLAVCPRKHPSRSEDAAPAPAATPLGSRAGVLVPPAPQLQRTDSE